MRALAALLALVSCQTLAVDLGPSAPPEWSGELDAALAYWQACGYPVARAPGGVLVEEGDTGHLGIWTPDDQRITLRKTAPGPVPDWVVAGEPCAWSFEVREALKHEIGHVLGFGHEARPDDVMYHLMPFCAARTFDVHCPASR